MATRRQRAATAGKAAATRRGTIVASNREVMRQIENELATHRADQTARMEAEARARAPGEKAIARFRDQAASHEQAATREATASDAARQHSALASLYRQAADRQSFLEHVKGSRSTEDQRNRAAAKTSLTTLKQQIKEGEAAIKAGSAASKPSGTAPRQTLTSARAQLRDLTSKVNAADAEVNRAVNTPRDSQDYHRSYTALQAATRDRDTFLASLSAAMRDKLTAAATPRTGNAATRRKKSA